MMSLRRAFLAATVLFMAPFAYTLAAAAPSAVKALVAYEHSHYHNNDVEQPQCFVLQSWAQCSFGTGHGNAEVNAWLHLRGGSWRFLGEGGGVTFASMLEKWYGIPAPIAKEFQAKQ
jgi:hypothetical protein